MRSIAVCSVNRVKGQLMSGSVIPTLTIELPAQISSVWMMLLGEKTS
ncbi:hypothetical protein [Chamaesiphon sp. OTE_20_metabat_361]|nr:hypothetical protein [Chamaesiphon sp. OTE_20_metabat_361]